MMDINVDLLQWFINFFEKATSGVKNENMTEQQLAEELHKPIIRNFRKRKLHSSFTEGKEIVFYYKLLIFSVNTYGFFL